MRSSSPRNSASSRLCVRVAVLQIVLEHIPNVPQLRSDYNLPLPKLIVDYGIIDLRYHREGVYFVWTHREAV